MTTDPVPPAVGVPDPGPQVLETQVLEADPGVPDLDVPDLAELAAAAALAVPGVAGLYPGAFGEIATHLPGRRVAGVRRRSTGDGTSIDVHVVALLGGDLRELAAAVHRAVRAAVGGDVHVYVDDLLP